MKKLLLLVSLVTAYLHGFTQSALVLNDESKLMYYKVNNLSSTDTVQLAQQAAALLKKKYPDLKLSELQPGSAGLNGKGKMLVYRKGLFSGQEEGQVTYNLKLEAKPNRYRVILTDFIFTPLKRTRYGTFGPVDGASTTIEKLAKNIKSSTYENYTQQVYTYSAYLNQQLYDYLMHPENKKAEPKSAEKVSTKNW
jgi:hypothetical protein